MTPGGPLEHLDRVDRLHELLRAIARVQALYISDSETVGLYTELLDQLVELSRSAKGFIVEVERRAEGACSRDECEVCSMGLPLSCDPTSPYREAVEATIGGGVPVFLAPDEVGPEAAVALPLTAMGQVQGVAVLMGRPDGYHMSVVPFLEPMLATCGQIISAFRTERLRARAVTDLARSEARKAAILDTVLDGIITIDVQGRIGSANPAAERIFGYAEQEMLGRPVTMLMPEPYHSEHDGYLRRYLDTGVPRIIGRGREVEGRRKDGSVFPLDLGVSDAVIDGEHLFTGIIRDITERKRVQDLKDAFISTVSHELRTPLTSIRGALGLLDGGVAGPLPDQASKLVGVARRNAERLVRLVDDILDMERVASGRLVMSPESCDVRTLVEEAVDETSSFGAEHGVGYALGPDEGETLVHVDRDRLVQITVNLLSNAAKYGGEGTVDVQVRRLGELVRVSVADRGAGLPAEFRERVFEAFARADSSSTRSVGGTGLGLNISRVLVERSGGHIGFRPRAGGGTVFYFDLPVTGAEQDRKSRVLVCTMDDEESASLCDPVVAAGHPVDAACVRARIRDQLARASYGWVVIGESWLDALDFIAVIRRVQPSTRVRVAVSASHSEIEALRDESDVVVYEFDPTEAVQA